MKYKFLLNILFTLIILQNNCFAQNKLEQEYVKYYNLTIDSVGKNSLQYSFKALELANKLNDINKIGNCYLEISFDYDDLGNYTSALEYAIKAAEIFKKQNNYKSLATTYAMLGDIYSSINNYKLAIKYFNQSIDLKKYRRELSVGYTYVNLSDVYRLIPNYDSALHYAEKGFDICKKHTDSMGIGYSLCNIGLIHLKQNNKVGGDSIIQNAFEILIEQGDYLAIIITKYEMAQMEFDAGNIKTAKLLAQEALDYAQKYKFNSELKDLLQLLALIAQKEGEFELAYSFLSDYQNLKDSIINDEVVSQMAEMRAEFEISQNEAEMTYLKRISSARAKMLIMAGVGLFAILILSVFLYIRSKQRKYANEQLSESNEELKQKNDIINDQLAEKEILMKEIHHRVKNNLQIISSIINLQSMRIDNEATVEIFNEMQRRIMAISSIHQKLYQSDSVSLINMKDYLGEVVDATHNAFNNDNLNVSYQISIENVNLNIDAAVSIGLILNELATNAYKYAFTSDKENFLYVSLVHDGDSTCNLIVKDNGPGIPEDKNIFESNSLGLRMVSLLTRQMKGKAIAENDEGTKFSISFKEIKNIQ